MRALTWHGKRDVRVDTVADPVLRDDDDIIVRVTTTGLCGSDLHLYEVLGAFLDPGDILGHEPMGIVEEVGSAVSAVKPGDRVVIPFNVSCGACFMCGQGLHSQCETTQVHEHGTGASLFGYTKLYGQVPGGQAQYLRVPFGNTFPFRKGRAMTASCTCPMFCPPRGRQWSTPPSRQAAASSYSASDRSGT